MEDTEPRDGGEVSEPPSARKRLNLFGRMDRQGRIFARLRDGWAYEEIAQAEGVTTERIRQIVAEALKKRKVDEAGDHAKLQLARLEQIMSIAGEALARGDLRGGSLYLRTIDRLDRHQQAARAIQRDEVEIRQRLLAKLNEMAAREGYDAVLMDKLQKVRDEHEDELRREFAARYGTVPPPKTPAADGAV